MCQDGPILCYGEHVCRISRHGISFRRTKHNPNQKKLKIILYNLIFIIALTPENNETLNLKPILYRRNTQNKLLKNTGLTRNPQTIFLHKNNN